MKQKQEEQHQSAAADYLKSEEIGLVIAEGVANLYKAHPKNPVDYLAKWLLNYANVKKLKLAQVEAERQINQHRKEHMAKTKEEEVKAGKLKQEDQMKVKKIADFGEMLRNSSDLNENLQSLVDHLQKATNATAVYIGKLTRPFNKITEASSEQDHLNPEAE